MLIIKQKPEDFIVNEISNIELKDKGDYSIFLLEKTNYTTEKAVQTIAKRLRIHRKFIGYAGNKDKIAVTTQYISIKNAKIKELKLKDIGLELEGYSDKPISLGDLEGNEFEVKVITDRRPKKIDKMINYFGEQRFSKNNEEVGKAIVKGDFRKAAGLIYEEKIKEHLKGNPNDFIGALRKIPIKTLKIYVHAYQSYLWNKLAEKSKSKTIPIIGFGTKQAKGVDEILKKEGITLRDFIIRQIPELSSEGSERGLFAEIKDLDIEKIKQGHILKFKLKKGCYATEAIKQIFA